MSRYPKVALVGCGYWGKNLCRNFSALGALGALGMVVDATETGQVNARSIAADVQFSSKIEDALTNPDIQALALAALTEIQAAEIDEANSSVYAQYTILSERRADVQNHLKVQGIPSVSYYSVPLHLQPVFADLGYRMGDFPVSEKIANNCLSLPMSPYLTESDQDKVLDAIIEESKKS